MSEELVKDEERVELEIVCEPNGTVCNICGSQVPEGDFGCGNGHIVGGKYRVWVPKN
jgi:hypothetical protein